MAWLPLGFALVLSSLAQWTPSVAERAVEGEALAQSSEAEVPPRTDDERSADRELRPAPEATKQASGTFSPIVWRYRAYFGFFEPGEENPARITSLGHYEQGERQHVQWDNAFAGGQLFTSHAEQWGPEGRRLVWRELAKGAGPGHTVVLETSYGSNRVHLSRYGLRTQVHGLQEAPDEATGPAWMPWQWLQHVRRGQSLPAGSLVLHPQTGRWEAVACLELPVPVALGWNHPGQEPLRYVRLHWLASETISEFVFSGQDVVSFRWHARGPWAQAVTAEAWHTWNHDWHGQADFSARGPRARAMEAAAPFLDKRARQTPLWWRNDGQPLDTSRLQRQRF